jgi:hypothetical protein
MTAMSTDDSALPAPDPLPRASVPDAPAAAPTAMHRGRIIFRARRPVALVLPLALVTEAGGIICLVAGATIGWFIVAAPLIALISTGAALRPALELTRDGLVQRQYPFSSLTRWDVVDRFGIERAGNRVVLAYKLAPGIPPPRRQPAAAMLRAANSDFDGGYFADSLAAKPADVLAVVDHYLRTPLARDALPPTRR